MPNTNAPPPGGAPDLTERIVDAALEIAEEKGSWSAVRLHDVSDQLSVPASQILDYYRDLDAVADAWFLRGLKAMVGPKPADFLDYPEWRRIEICILAWFDTLSEHGGSALRCWGQAAPIASASLGADGVQSLAHHSLAARSGAATGRIWHPPCTTRGGWTDGGFSGRPFGLDAR